MSYQSEAQLEAQLIEQLQSQNYTKVILPDYDAVLANFRVQFERFNAANLGGKPLSDKEWERVLNYVNGKSIFESAKCVRRRGPTAGPLKSDTLTAENEHPCRWSDSRQNWRGDRHDVSPHTVLFSP